MVGFWLLDVLDACEISPAFLPGCGVLYIRKRWEGGKMRGEREVLWDMVGI